MPEFLQGLTDRLHSMGTGAYWVVAVIVYFETVIGFGQVIPGSVFLAFVGFLCYLQMFDFGDMLFAVFVAHFAGEVTNYLLGRLKGRALFHEESRWFRPALLDAAERRFMSGGAKIIFISQFTGFFRALIPFAAGATRYPAWKFLTFIGIAAFLWALIHLGIGFLFGASWQQAVHYVEGLSLFILATFGAVLLAGWFIRRIAQSAGEVGVWLEATSRAIHRSEHYQAIAGTSPRVFGFLERRLSLSRSWGIGATLGFLVTGVLFLFFALILHEVSNGDSWKYFDLSIVNLLAQLRRPGADQLFIFVTNLGNTPVVLFVTVLTVVLCLRARQGKSAVVVLGSVLLAIALSQLIKHVYGRARPISGVALVTARGFSFPSGHATVAVALFAALYYWLWNHPGRYRLRVALAFVVVVFILLIGFSRVYLGVHFPSDVFAGFLLGSACVVFTGTVARNIMRLPDEPRRADLRALVVIVTQISLVAVLFWRQSPMPRARIVEADKAKRVTTTETLIAHTPRQATGLTGDLTIPTNMVLVGSPVRMVNRLEALGWQHVQPWEFFTRQIQAPVFPAFVDGVPAAVTMQRRTGDTRTVVRLWHANDTLNGTPAWVGGILGEDKKPKFLGISVFRTIPDLDATMDAFAESLAGLSVGRIDGFRPRALYEWRRPFFTHGYGLLIDGGE